VREARTVRGATLTRGAVRSSAVTVNLRDAGVGSTFPAASIARTLNVWTPAASPVNRAGLAHGAQAPPSRRHSKRAPASLAENANVALLPLTAPSPIAVSGGVVSGCGGEP
jgi:hypothetical protein